jgi:hypothetical protein
VSIDVQIDVSLDPRPDPVLDRPNRPKGQHDRAKYGVAATLEWTSIGKVLIVREQQRFSQIYLTRLHSSHEGALPDCSYPVRLERSLNMLDRVHTLTIHSTGLPTSTSLQPPCFIRGRGHAFDSSSHINARPHSSPSFLISGILGSTSYFEGSELCPTQALSIHSPPLHGHLWWREISNGYYTLLRTFAYGVSNGINYEA